MLAMGGDEVTEAVTCAARVLRGAAGEDWHVGAGRLDWSCRATAEHLAGELLTQAGRLTVRAADAYVPFGIALDDGTDNADVVQAVQATGGLLAAAVRTARPGARGSHPFPDGSADATGFAAMGVTETLLHTHDITQGLGIVWEPPAELCEAVLSRIFPQVRPGPDPWRTLLWATGRGPLPGREPVGSWRWHNAVAIRSDRVELRETSPAVAADLHLGGTGGYDWIDGGPFQGTRDAAGMVVKQYEAGVLRPGWGVYVVVRTADERALGGIGFHGAPDGDGRAEVGYDLAPAARGQGYATEALRALSTWALTRPGADVLHAVVDQANAPSHAVVTRAGYTRVALPEGATVTGDEGRIMTLYAYSG